MNTTTTTLPRPAHGLRRRLLQRVQLSHRHEAQFQTVRRDTGAWHDEHTGVRFKPLAQTALARSVIAELDPLAWLPVSPGHSQAELVVLDGSAKLGETAFACGDAGCAPHAGTSPLQAGPQGARLYLRLSAPADPPPEPVRFSAVHGDAGWVDFCPGVRIKLLWDGGERRSLLVRMRAGAVVGAHVHALEEECMMLAGEAFVGDTLLRSGEYQLAPAGSEHGAVMTDVGALFYVHGALDPAAYS